MPPGRATVTSVLAAGSPLIESSTKTVAIVNRLRPTHWLLVWRHVPVTITDASLVICSNDSSTAVDVVCGDESMVCCALVRLTALAAQSPAMTRTIRKTPLKAYNFFFIFFSFVVNG